MTPFKRALVLAAACVALVGCTGKIYRADHYLPSETVYELPNAKVVMGMGFADDIADNSARLRWDRPDVRPRINVFLFDPAIDTCRVNEMAMWINETNRVEFVFAHDDNELDGRDQHFEPYLDEAAFDDQYPGIKPRYVYYYPIRTEIPESAREPGATVRVEMDMELLAGETSVLRTNLLTAFVLERKDQRETLVDMLFRLVMPRF
ncbi:MAG TPA: hypothetical protein PK388_03505 [Kiritimatiellia bacterium]|nr:hypothetical protein [Kiritimatiellia bacterium]